MQNSTHTGVNTVLRFFSAIKNKLKKLPDDEEVRQTYTIFEEANL
ncbi:hypothetical protein [Desertivirga arenae]|nr:hypothetical protein [Pedobacter sp. SYSU D00823]